MKQEAKIWRLTSFDNLELLKGTYVSQIFPRHFHDTFCIGVIEKGSEVVELEDRKVIASSNQIIFINPNEVHSNYALNESGWTYRMIYLNPEVFSFFSPKTIQIPSGVLDDQHIYNSILEFHQSAENSEEKDLESKLQKFISLLSEKVSSHFTNSDKSQYLKTKVFQDLKLYLEQHFDRKIKFEELEKIGGCNKYKLIRIFKKEMGLTPFEYLNVLRIEKAKKELKKGLSLSQAGLESGFYDQSHFSHYFKKYTGITPKVYQTACNILQD